MAARSINNVVFDFGGVLVNWQPQRVVAEMFESPELRETIMDSVLRHPDWLELDRGTLQEPEAVVRFAARTGIAERAIEALMDRLRNSLTLIAETTALLRELAASGVPVYGLSNMPATTFAFLQSRYDVWSLFRGIVISGEIGLVKPDVRIFEHLLSAHGLDEAESIFVDDLEVNVAAADRVGFQTLLYRNGSSSMDELRKRLGRS